MSIYEIISDLKRKRDSALAQATRERVAEQDATERTRQAAEKAYEWEKKVDELNGVIIILEKEHGLVD